MPRGRVLVEPTDGLTTRQRRHQPLLIVHTGPMKGKSTAAFGLGLRGWSQGWSVAVFQFVKSAKWKVGEESAFRALGELHDRTGDGGPVEWHKMGHGWSWARKPGSPDDHAAAAVEGWAEIRGRQHVVITGREAPPALVDAADLVMHASKIKHPMDAGRKGQRGIEW